MIGHQMETFLSGDDMAVFQYQPCCICLRVFCVVGGRDWAPDGDVPERG